MKARKSMIIIFLNCLARIGFAQDVQYSQFYASTMYLNPAFTGSSELTRVGINLRNQWPGLDQTFLSYSAYIEHFVPQKNSGFGLLINGSNGTLSSLNNIEVGMLYSYRLRIADNRYFHFGAQGSLVSRSSNFDKVILSTQLDIDRGVILDGGGNPVFDESKRNFMDFNTGILYYDTRKWLGASAHHLTQPQISYLDNASNKLAIKYSLHGGIRFNFKSGFINDYFNNTRQERSVSFAFNYKNQGDFNQLDIGTELYFEPIVLGMWYRGLPTKYALPNNEALIGLVGFSLADGLDMGYSYDFTVSKLGWRNAGGAHEVSMRYSVNRDVSKNRSRSVMPGFKY